MHVNILTFKLSVFSERSYQVHDFAVAVGKGDDVGWSGQRQQKSQRSKDCAGKHDI